MGRRSWSSRRSLIVRAGTAVLVTVMVGLGVASAGYSSGSGCAYDSSGVSCPALPAYEWSGTVYDRHQYDLARCAGMSAADALSASKLSGATVDLLRRASGNSAFVEVPSDSPGIAPATNPETTDSNGRYGWSISAGNYEVVVSQPGYATNRTAEQKVPPAHPSTDVGLFKPGDPTSVTCPAPPTATPSPGSVAGASAGGATVACTVPDLVKHKKTIVRTRLSAAHCSLGKLIKRHNKAKRGLVTKVSPPAGSVLRANYGVSVVVSLGPKAKPKTHNSVAN